MYILACIFFIFVLLGVVGDRKRAAITEKLKEKKAQDIASGKEAKIAAMESKQILDVMEDPIPTTSTVGSSVPSNGVTNTNEEIVKKDEVPSVLVIGADTGSNTGAKVEINPNSSSALNNGNNTNPIPLVIPSESSSVTGSNQNV